MQRTKHKELRTILDMTPAPLMKPRVGDVRDAQLDEKQHVEASGALATKISVRGLNFFYGRTQALHNLSLEIPGRVVMAFIGPSGCGKSTFLRTLNRMNDTIPGTR